MKFIEKRTPQLVVCAAAVAVIGLLSPRAAHAVAAALVQVTNPITNPVITQPTVTAASQLVVLEPPSGTSLAPGAFQSLSQFTSAGLGVSANMYVVPTGQNLVITGVDVSPSASGLNTVQVYQSCGPTASILTYLNVLTTATVTARYPGIAIGAGCNVYVNYPTGPNGGFIDVSVYGYLTAN